MTSESRRACRALLGHPISRFFASRFGVEYKVGWMEYRILGPLEVRDGNESLPLGGSKQRAVLALLLLNANRVVAREQLVDGLWGETPPPPVSPTPSA